MVGALDLTKTLPDEFYDDSEFIGIDDIPIILANPTRDERREAKFFKSIYRGIMYVGGGARQGKDLFGMVMAYLMRRYFGRPVLLDCKPRRLFGEYTYFNPELMMNEISKMARLSTVETGQKEMPLDKNQEKAFTEASNEWIEDNKVKFQNAIIYLSELGRYCPRRNPHNRVNRFIGALNSQWGHLDFLMVGTHLQQNEIDLTTYMGKVKLWVNCTWMISRQDTTHATIVREMYLDDSAVINASLPVMNYYVNGGKPREFLTHEKTYFKITPYGQRQRNGHDILAYLDKYGVKQADVIANRLGANVPETLEALFKLSLSGCVIGNRFFDLYNSKGFVNLKPTIGKEV